MRDWPQTVSFSKHLRVESGGASGILIFLALLFFACSPSTAPGASKVVESSRPVKTITIGVTTQVQSMGVFAGQSVGGWTSLSEIHSAGLVTSDFASNRPIGRLAEQVPSVDDGSMTVMGDGRMRVVYRLRRNVTWQDGTPFTSQDIVFSHAFLRDSGLPVTLRETVRFIDTVEALDDWTVVMHFAQPYYLGGLLGLREFWPQPRHLLGDAYDRYRASGGVDEVAQLPYWTSSYVNLGPFRVISFDPGQGISLQAYPDYFLGRPKLDVIHVRAFADQNTLFSNLLAGTVDLFSDTSLSADLGERLKQLWEPAGQGTVHARAGATYFLSPQWRPEVQREPANLDVRVRQALYQAIDRDALAGIGAVQPAWSILPPDDRLYEATRDGLRRYPYDPARSRAVLIELGWSPGPDGILRHNSDGRRFSNTISAVSTGRIWEVSTYADAWRRIGIEVEERQVSPAQARNLEFRAHYPSWEATSAGQGDSLLRRLQGPAASAANQWSGNRGGYEDPAAQALLARYYASVTDQEQSLSMRQIADFIAAELPMLVTYFNTDHIGVRKGVQALDDIRGGQHSSRPYGTYTRNAHLWDVE